MTSDEARQKLTEIIQEAGFDISFGMAQLTVATAAGYGIGDGSNTTANCLYVRDELWYRSVSIDLGARHLSGNYGQADNYDYAAMGLSQSLAALVIYNAGHLPAKDSPWWQKWAGNIAGYKAALEWAKGVLA